jgi:hypothetical protein
MTVAERMWAEEVIKVGWAKLVSDPMETIPELGRNLINRINLLEDMHRVELASVKAAGGTSEYSHPNDSIACGVIQHCTFKGRECE